MEKSEARKLFYSQERLPVDGTKDDEHFTFYRLGRSCQTVCEINLSLGLDGEEIELAHITDIHLNHYNADDLLDEEIMDSVRHREWLKGAECVLPAERAMNAAAYADQTVITGDIVDYLSRGARELAQKYVLSRDPGLLCSPGLHDFVKELETGKPEKLSYEEREKILQSFWPNDLHYASKILKNKLIVAVVDNSQNHYCPKAYEPLKAEIEKARENGLKILVFQHEPLSTHNSADTLVKSNTPIVCAAYDFFDGPRINGGSKANETDKKFYQLLLNSTDVVKGVFAGHLHNTYYTEIKGENGAFIPQYVSLACLYFGGSLTRIIIK